MASMFDHLRTRLLVFYFPQGRSLESATTAWGSANSSIRLGGAFLEYATTASAACDAFVVAIDNWERGRAVPSSPEVQFSCITVMRPCTICRQVIARATSAAFCPAVGSSRITPTKVQSSTSSLKTLSAPAEGVESNVATANHTNIRHGSQPLLVMPTRALLG